MCQKWVFSFRPWTEVLKYEMVHKSNPRPQKAQTVSDKRIVICDHIVPSGHKIIENLYSNVLQGPLKAKWKKKGHFIKTLTMPRLTEKRFVNEQLRTRGRNYGSPSAPHSPDLAPCDFLKSKKNWEVKDLSKM